MLSIVASGVAAFVTAKRSHLGILLIAVALILKGATPEQLLDGLRILCGHEQGTVSDSHARRKPKAYSEGDSSPKPLDSLEEHPPSPE